MVCSWAASVLMESSAALVLEVIHPRLRARWLLRMVKKLAAKRSRPLPERSNSAMFWGASRLAETSGCGN